MPTKGHHRSRSSIDRVIELLADLEESQIAVLLDELNHTTSSNVPVSEAIALFEQHANKPRRRFGRSPSPVRALQVELERRHSKRISSAPEPKVRTKAASFTPPTLRQQTALPPDPPSVSPPAQPAPKHLHSDRPDHTERPSLTLPPPVPIERPKSPKSSPAGSPSDFRPPSYKRISRPTFLSPTATAELHLLLLAFFNDNPTSATTPATPSPSTPQFFGMSHSPFSDFEPEPCTPGLDLLEPSPFRTPSTSSGRSIRTMPSMSSIFEVLTSQ
ncbi:uncharacterized protein THITE_2107752 [Thermothielavioides terrestris NRRL 8126]|uniref:Uncharacterized protein n=1 Tax=Thermothielavioides terrestris (strain ATCC 38088 / NRRL 8126) TaxID=578455 RepID=G2QV45_THETT|nr:uncharacterized protein THITE_2107752 [Thermothielavioides terrestris NRRL 8126]AEO62932.1 hypothetical protein THITE_2107752 [Thermothielavioides terrestris NRRL 8126]